MTAPKAKPKTTTRTRTTKPSNIFEAFVKVMESVGFVATEERADMKYKYTSESGLLKAIRPAFVEQGIIVYPKEILELNREFGAFRSGSPKTTTVVKYIYCFHHAPTDTSFDIQVIGEGEDPFDKASNKAMTTAFKYALRQSLMIVTGDDPDAADADSQPSTGTTQKKKTTSKKKSGNGSGSGPSEKASAEAIARYDELIIEAKELKLRPGKLPADISKEALELIGKALAQKVEQAKAAKAKTE